MKYIILAEPKPLARARNNKVKMYDAQKQMMYRWRNDLENQHNDAPLYQGPLHLDISFYFEPPKQTARANIPNIINTYTPNNPLLSNLLKMIEDCCFQVLYTDNAQIAYTSMKKLYDITPRIEFCITELEKKNETKKKC